mgnify:CR=1 FL=1
MASLSLPWADTLAEADRLERRAADPKKPYEFMYQARDVLTLLRGSLAPPESGDGQQQQPQQPPPPQQQQKTTQTSTQRQQQVAVLDYRLGKNYLDTEETHDAEKHLMCALTTMLPEAWAQALQAARRRSRRDGARPGRAPRCDARRARVSQRGSRRVQPDRYPVDAPGATPARATRARHGTAAVQQVEGCLWRQRSQWSYQNGRRRH